MRKYKNYLKQLNSDLNNVETILNQRKVSVDKGIDWLINKSFEIQKKRRCIFLTGNGASASMASHTALDMWKNANIRSTTFNDLVSLTAVSNDISYEDVFSTPFKFFCEKGDMIVCISSSGKSPNIIKSAQTAKKKKIAVVTFSGMAKDNPLRKLGDLNFYVPAPTYGEVEISHQALLHFWIDSLLIRQCG